jgi:sugar fermentation stimulation protein A
MCKFLHCKERERYLYNWQLRSVQSNGYMRQTMQRGRELVKGPPLLRADVLRRPSAVNKSPYVADIQLLHSGEETLAHTPSLDAGGLVGAGKRVFVREESARRARKTRFTVVGGQASNDFPVGLEPLVANRIAHELTCKELGIALPPLDAEVAKKVKSDETTNTRFDFADPEQDVFVEVKSVPLALDGAAYFPHGTPKKKGEPVSERANKHLRELAHLARHDNAKAVVLFISQRNDISKVVPSYEDPTFREALQDALDAGVIAKAFSVCWHETGECTLAGEIAIDMECEPPQPPTPPKKREQGERQRSKRKRSGKGNSECKSVEDGEEKNADDDNGVAGNEGSVKTRANK